MKAEVRVLAAVRTLCRVAVSDGFAVRAESELKKESIAVPSAVELADVVVELREKMGATGGRAGAIAPLWA